MKYNWGMQRFVLRYRGSGAAPDADVRRVRATASVIDESPRMLLVDGDGGVLRGLLADLSDWSLSEEHAVSLPDTRYRTSRS
jgi:hypothetical protein